MWIQPINKEGEGRRWERRKEVRIEEEREEKGI